MQTTSEEQRLVDEVTKKLIGYSPGQRLRYANPGWPVRYGYFIEMNKIHGEMYLWVRMRMEDTGSIGLCRPEYISPT